MIKRMFGRRSGWSSQGDPPAAFIVYIPQHGTGHRVDGCDPAAIHPLPLASTSSTVNGHATYVNTLERLDDLSLKRQLCFITQDPDMIEYSEGVMSLDINGRTVRGASATFSSGWACVASDGGRAIGLHGVGAAPTSVSLLEIDIRQLLG